MYEQSKGWHGLQTHVQELVHAAGELQALASQETSSVPHEGMAAVFSSSDQSFELKAARKKLTDILGQIQILVAEPDDFIQHLAHHTQLLACIQWLGEFQVLGCIPLDGSVAANEVADLAEVPASQLIRIVRMTAAAGFLDEPHPGYIAHTPLSTYFVSDLSYLDAAMLLAETAAPAALQMTAATREGIESRDDDGGATAYNLAFSTTQSFQSACAQRPRLHRQWNAYVHYIGANESDVVEVLNGAGWLSLRDACVVHVGTTSASTTRKLAHLNPSLRYVAQLSSSGLFYGTEYQQARTPDVMDRTDPFGSVSVQYRAPGSPQTIKDATIYVLHLSSIGAITAGESLRSRIQAELRAQIEALRDNKTATLILLPDLLSDHSNIGSKDIRASTYLRDLSLWQMTKGWCINLTELLEIVNSVQDSTGRLVVENRLQLSSGATTALYVKYVPRWGA